MDETRTFPRRKVKMRPDDVPDAQPVVWSCTTRNGKPKESTMQDSFKNQHLPAIPWKATPWKLDDARFIKNQQSRSSLSLSISTSHVLADQHTCTNLLLSLSRSLSLSVWLSLALFLLLLSLALCRALCSFSLLSRSPLSFSYSPLSLFLALHPDSLSFSLSHTRARA